MSAAPPNLFMMPWYPRDFMAATRGWPLIARAICRELLDVQWEQGSLPDEPAALRELVGATPAEWRAGWPRVQSKFRRCPDGLLRNTRLEEHRQRSVALYSRHRKGAALTNAKRWGNGVAERVGERIASESPQSQSLRGLREEEIPLGESLRSAGGEGLR